MREKSLRQTKLNSVICIWKMGNGQNGIIWVAVLKRAMRKIKNAELMKIKPTVGMGQEFLLHLWNAHVRKFPEQLSLPIDRLYFMLEVQPRFVEGGASSLKSLPLTESPCQANCE